MKLKIWERALIAALILCVVFGFQVEGEARELSSKLIRLHVVANSDSEADQSEKLQVRDAVLAYLAPKLEGVESAGDAAKIIESEIEGIRGAAAGITDKSVTVKLARESFPTTDYDTFSLPAGVYNSLRVIIGKGAGHNWWCVVFPPVCGMPEIDPEAAAAIGLTGEDAELITRDGAGYVVKFRVMEWLGWLRGLLER